MVYPSGFVYNKLVGSSLFGIPMLYLYLANPMTDIVLGFQRALYRTVDPVVGVDKAGHAIHSTILMPVSVGWLAVLLAAVTVGSLILLVLAWRTFFRLSGDFAEEL